MTMTGHRGRIAVLLAFLTVILSVASAAFALSAWDKQSSGVTEDLNSVSSVGDAQAWAVGENGTIVRTIDGGANWDKQSSGTSAWLESVIFLDSANGWVVGNEGTILATHDGGESWTSQDSGTSYDFDAVTFIDANNGWAIATQWTDFGPTDSRVFRTTDGGLHWTGLETIDALSLSDIQFIDANHGWALGLTDQDAPASSFFRTTDGGALWAETRIAGYALRALTFIDANHGWAVGHQTKSPQASVIFKTTDGGVTWHPQSLGEELALKDVAFVDSSTGWVAGGSPKEIGDVLLSTKDGGATWIREVLPDGGMDVRSISFSDSSRGWAVSRMGQVWRMADTTALDTTLSLSAPTVSGYATAKLAGYLKDVSGRALGGKLVMVQQLTNGAWTTLATVSTSSTQPGYYSYTAKPTTKTSYRVVFAADDLYLGQTSETRVVLPEVYITTPVFRKTASGSSVTALKYGTTYYVNGSLKPRHAVGSTQIKIKAYRYQSGKWVYKKTYTAKASNDSNYSRYMAKISLPTKGAWQLRANHAADTTNAGTYSSYRKVTVK